MVLNQLLGEAFKVRLCAEKKCKEKEYELQSNQACVIELEETLENEERSEKEECKEIIMQHE